MCNSRNPFHTIIEVSELFQEFLKHAFLDGYVESWCLEIRLQKKETDDIEDVSTSPKGLIYGLHSLYYLIVKTLNENQHEMTCGSCTCGWVVSHIPDFQHSEIHRYTSGTIIRWSQGECHVLLAPFKDCSVLSSSENGNEQKSSSPEDSSKIDKKMSGSIIRENEPDSEAVERLGVIKIAERNVNESGSNERNSAEPSQILSPSRDKISQSHSLSDTTSENVPESQYFLKHQHFCEDTDSHSPHERDKTLHEEKNSMKTDIVRSNRSETTEHRLQLDDSDEEGSRMLIINEEANSMQEILGDASDRKENDIESDMAKRSDLSFHHVLPLNTDNVRTHSEGKEPARSPYGFGRESHGDKEERRDDDDSTSVSSSSSSSSYTSSSTSDDDDRIKFEQRVEKAAQAAREAAATAVVTPLQNHFQPPSTQSCLQDNMFMNLEDPGQLRHETSTISPHHILSPPSITAFRHPDDLQAAQGLAALGKSQKPSDSNSDTNGTEPDFEPSTIDEIPKGLVTTKVSQRLLQNKGTNICKLGPNNFQCGICGSVFNRLEKVLEHHFRHSGIKPWECDACDKKFANYHSLQKHVRVKHTPAHLREFTCNICDKSFGVPSALQRHMSTHNASKPFACEVCGQMFALKFTKIAHESLHTGERPWSCSVCGKTFVTKYKLKFHMKGHTGELYCNICDRTFASQDVLTRHRKRHENGDKGKLSKTAASKRKKFQETKKMSVSAAVSGNMNKSAVPSISVLPLTSESGFRCQMCGKMFAKSTDLTHHLPSCNAITYWPPSTLQMDNTGTAIPAGGSSQPLGILQTSDQPSSSAQFHHQLLPPGPPPTLPKCLMIEEKKMEQYNTCDVADISIAGNLEIGLGRKTFMMDHHMAPSTSQLPQMLQHQQPVIPTPGHINELPDYLNEVSFGTPEHNSSIIFQPSHGQG